MMRLTGFVLLALAIFGALNLALTQQGTVDEYAFCGLLAVIGFMLVAGGRKQ